VGYQILVCLKSFDDCHLSVHLEIMFSLSSFLIALLAFSPRPSTAVELPPAFASLSASSLPRMPAWALTHSRTTVLFLPSLFRVSLVSLHVLCQSSPVSLGLPGCLYGRQSVSQRDCWISAPRRQTSQL
jgi:hypothetical protein